MLTRGIARLGNPAVSSCQVWLCPQAWLPPKAFCPPPVVQYQPCCTVVLPRVDVLNLADRLVGSGETEGSSKTAPSRAVITERIESLLQMFPLSSTTIEHILTTSPELLKLQPKRIQEFSQIIIEAGDHELFSEAESLTLLGSCPDILQLTQINLQLKLSNLFGQCSSYLIPWNVVLLATPQVLYENPTTVSGFFASLGKYFDSTDVYNLLGNNPSLLATDMSSVSQQLQFYLHTMTISPTRIAKTQNSLTVSLDQMKLRYEFLKRSGNYQHLDPNQKGKKLIEAKPAFSQIVNLPDREFLQRLVPGVRMEEFNMFKSLFHLEMMEKDQILDEMGFVQSDLDPEMADELLTGYRQKKTSKKRKKNR